MTVLLILAGLASGLGVAHLTARWTCSRKGCHLKYEVEKPFPAPLRMRCQRCRRWVYSP